jgi:CheY-like chemotaxis protein/anti-sigma regulatory factor (Ser/Thr protein kinase)
LECVPVDLRTVVEKSVGLLALQAAEKGLHLFFNIDSSAPYGILGDAMRLRQVLANLLGNAVKFTAAGEVSLTVTGGPGEDGHQRITFIVRDTGPGIPLEHQQRIFDSFSQVDASISRKYGGTGLGLAISRSLAEQMGGSISVESQPGCGATFCFTLRALAVTERPPAARKPASGDLQVAGLPALRIIVAEDNPVNREVVLAFLRRLGYEPDVAINGVELLDMLARGAYDVIFMDVQMPEVDGLEATRRVRRDFPPAAQPRIIAMTAAAFPEDRARCLEAGMDDYVSKPVAMAELVEALRRARP